MRLYPQVGASDRSGSACCSTGPGPRGRPEHCCYPSVHWSLGAWRCYTTHGKDFVACPETSRLAKYLLRIVAPRLSLRNGRFSKIFSVSKTNRYCWRIVSCPFGPSRNQAYKQTSVRSDFDALSNSPTVSERLKDNQPTRSPVVGVTLEPTSLFSFNSFLVQQSMFHLS